MTDYEKYTSTYEDKRFCPNCGNTIIAEITEPQGAHIDDETDYCIFRDMLYIHKVEREGDSE